MCFEHGTAGCSWKTEGKCMLFMQFNSAGYRRFCTEHNTSEGLRMIEMRWVRRMAPTNIEQHYVEHSLILQYRYRQPDVNTEFRSLPQNTWPWSEWQDVAPPSVTV